MSAPRTNVDRQRRRHIVPLAGMALAAIFGVVIIVYWLFEEAATSNPPEPPQATGTAPATGQPTETLGPDVQTGVPGTTTAPTAPQPTPQTPPQTGTD